MSDGGKIPGQGFNPFAKPAPVPGSAPTDRQIRGILKRIEDDHPRRPPDEDKEYDQLITALEKETGLRAGNNSPVLVTGGQSAANMSAGPAGNPFGPSGENTDNFKTPAQRNKRRRKLIDTPKGQLEVRTIPWSDYVKMMEDLKQVVPSQPPLLDFQWENPETKEWFWVVRGGLTPAPWTLPHVPNNQPATNSPGTPPPGPPGGGDGSGNPEPVRHLPWVVYESMVRRLPVQPDTLMPPRSPMRALHPETGENIVVDPPVDGDRMDGKHIPENEIDETGGAPPIPPARPAVMNTEPVYPGVGQPPARPPYTPLPPIPGQRPRVQEPVRRPRNGRLQRVPAEQKDENDDTYYDFQEDLPSDERLGAISRENIQTGQALAVFHASRGKFWDRMLGRNVKKLPAYELYFMIGMLLVFLATAIPVIVKAVENGDKTEKDPDMARGESALWGINTGLLAVLFYGGLGSTGLIGRVMIIGGWITYVVFALKALV